MSRWKASPGARRLLQFGELCFVIGLLPWVFPHWSYGLRPVPLHFLSGLLLGLSVGVMAGAMYKARRADRCS